MFIGLQAYSVVAFIDYFSIHMLFEAKVMVLCSRMVASNHIIHSTVDAAVASAYLTASSPAADFTSF